MRTISWKVELRSPRPMALKAFHGETLRLAVFVTDAGQPVTPATGAQVTFWYQAPNMGTEWFSAPGTIEEGCVCAAFTPEIDPGYDALRFFIEVKENGSSFAIHGSLTLASSPGFAASEIAPYDIAESLKSTLEAMRQCQVAVTNTYNQSINNYNAFHQTMQNLMIAAQNHRIAAEGAADKALLYKDNANSAVLRAQRYANQTSNDAINTAYDLKAVQETVAAFDARALEVEEQLNAADTELAAQVAAAEAAAGRTEAGAGRAEAALALVPEIALDTEAVLSASRELVGTDSELLASLAAEL